MVQDNPNQMELEEMVKFSKSTCARSARITWRLISKNFLLKLPTPKRCVEP